MGCVVKLGSLRIILKLDAYSFLRTFIYCRFFRTMLISEASDIYMKQKGIFIFSEPSFEEKTEAARENINYKCIYHKWLVTELQYLAELRLSLKDRKMPSVFGFNLRS